MRKTTPIARIASLSAFGLVATLLAATPAAIAQQQQQQQQQQAQPPAAKPQEPAPPAANAAMPAQQQQGQDEMGQTEEFVYEPLQVGDATQSLLAWQRGGEISSPTPRTIAGDVASRSYERYLKSFEFPIPERLTSSVRSRSNGGGSDSGGAQK